LFSTADPSSNLGSAGRGLFDSESKAEAVGANAPFRSTLFEPESPTVPNGGGGLFGSDEPPAAKVPFKSSLFEPQSPSAGEAESGNASKAVASKSPSRVVNADTAGVFGEPANTAGVFGEPTDLSWNLNSPDLRWMEQDSANPAAKKAPEDLPSARAAEDGGGNEEGNKKWSKLEVAGAVGAILFVPGAASVYAVMGVQELRKRRKKKLARRAIHAAADVATGQAGGKGGGAHRRGNSGSHFAPAPRRRAHRNSIRPAGLGSSPALVARKHTPLFDDEVDDEGLAPPRVRPSALFTGAGRRGGGGAPVGGSASTVERVERRALDTRCSAATTTTMAPTTMMAATTTTMTTTTTTTKTTTKTTTTTTTMTTMTTVTAAAIDGWRAAGGAGVAAAPGVGAVAAAVGRPVAALAPRPKSRRRTCRRTFERRRAHWRTWTRC
jgi:hypothetical protein